MLTRFFTSIRVMYAAGLINSRHVLEKRPALAFHHPLEQTLFDVLNSAESGVFVHWGAYESGKSTAVREAAWRLQEDSGRKVIFLRSYEYTWITSASAWLRRAIGVPEDMVHEPLSEFFTRPDTTIVIDHADMLMLDDTRAADMVQMTRGLLRMSTETRKFNVLLVLTSWERAKELCDAGCKLVGGPQSRWTRGQINALYSTLPDKAKSQMGARKDQLLRLATLSGTPGFLTMGVHSPWLDAQHAAMLDLEWRKGMKTLHAVDQLELAPGMAVEGRFPDKNGIFHHEDSDATQRLLC